MPQLKRELPWGRDDARLTWAIWVRAQGFSLYFLLGISHNIDILLIFLYTKLVCRCNLYKESSWGNPVENQSEIAGGSLATNICKIQLTIKFYHLKSFTPKFWQPFWNVSSFQQICLWVTLMIFQFLTAKPSAFSWYINWLLWKHTHSNLTLDAVQHWVKHARTRTIFATLNQHTPWCSATVRNTHHAAILTSNLHTCLHIVTLLAGPWASWNRVVKWQDPHKNTKFCICCRIRKSKL